MSQKVPYNIKSIDLNNINVKTPKIIKNKKIIFLKYDNNNFVIQLSKLENNIIFDSTNEIEFEINKKDQINFMNKLDDYIISLGKTNANEWFSHIDDKSSIDYQRILQYNNSVKIKIVNNDNFKTTMILNEEPIENLNNLENYSLNSKILLEIYAIWIKNNSFGLLLRPVNVAFTSINSYNYDFINETSSESGDNHSELFLKNLEMNHDTSDDDSDIDINKIILG